MKFWLSRRPNGYYIMTAPKPVRCRVIGTDREDLFIPYGDPIGVDNLCANGILMQYGHSLPNGEHLKPFQMIRVEDNARVLGEPVEIPVTNRHQVCSLVED